MHESYGAMQLSIHLNRMKSMIGEPHFALHKENLVGVRQERYSSGKVGVYLS